MTDLHCKAEEKTPYVLVALQECERMNMLTNEIRRTLKELDLGLKVNNCFYLDSQLLTATAAELVNSSSEETQPDDQASPQVCTEFGTTLPLLQIY